ncbi:MAG: hypothetical protein AB1390_07110 [Nitrospirota bacterium]
MLSYYKVENPPVKFSIFSDIKNKESFYQKYFNSQDNIVEIIAYCFMPTHIHLILKQMKKDGISIFMGKVRTAIHVILISKIKEGVPCGRVSSKMLKLEQMNIYFI